MSTKGKSYLKVSGALMAVFGVLSLVFNIVGLVGGGMLLAGSAIEGQNAAAFGSALIIVMFLLALAWSVLEVVTGIIGVKNCEKPEKAGLCFKLGIVVGLCTVIDCLSQLWMEGFSVPTIVGLVIGLILPALYCYGAKLNQGK